MNAAVQYEPNYRVILSCGPWEAGGSIEPGLEGFEFETGGNDPAFLVGVPVSAQGFHLILIGEGDIEGGLGGSASRSSSFLRRR